MHGLMVRVTQYCLGIDARRLTSGAILPIVMLLMLSISAVLLPTTVGTPIPIYLGLLPIQLPGRLHILYLLNALLVTNDSVSKISVL